MIAIRLCTTTSIAMTSQSNMRVGFDHVTWSVKMSVGLLSIVFLTLSRDVSPVAGKLVMMLCAFVDCM